MKIYEQSFSQKLQKVETDLSVLSTGEKLYLIRRRFGHLLKNVAKAAGVSQSALHRYETDQAKIKHETIVKIANHYGIDPRIFYE